jgi:hypothetical protein
MEKELTLIKFREQDGEMEYNWSYYYPTEWVEKTDSFTILKSFFNPYLNKDNDDLGLEEYWNGERAVCIESTTKLPLNIDLDFLRSIWIYGETNEPNLEE